MAYEEPTISEFKTYFVRDFPFGTDVNLAVVDEDITKALAQMHASINQECFADQDTFSIAAELLTAHFLVMNLRASSQGLAGQFSWLTTSKSVGSVSEGVQVPQRILDNPTLALFSKTNYGAQYIQMILPCLLGRVFTVCGATQA